MLHRKVFAWKLTMICNSAEALMQLEQILTRAMQQFYLPEPRKD
jgi:hypothetical protein